MIYLRARFYAPELNRFSQKDLLRGSVTQPGSLNRYAYVQNDPVNYVDPSGMRPIEGATLNERSSNSSSSGRAAAAASPPSVVPPVQQLNIHQTTAAAVTEAWRAAELAHRVAPGSPEAYRATQAYYETQRLAAQANASRNTQAARQAAQTAQASSSYVNNVAAGRAQNTYSPYDSNGNVYSYYNSSYDTGKVPSTNSPRVKDVDPGNVEYCEGGGRDGQSPAITQNTLEKIIGFLKEHVLGASASVKSTQDLEPKMELDLFIIQVTSGIRETTTFVEFGDSTKPLSVYADEDLLHPVVSSNAGVKINLFDLTLGANLSVNDLSVSVSAKDGDISTGYAVKADLTKLKVGVESTVSYSSTNENSGYTITDYVNSSVTGAGIMAVVAFVLSGGSVAPAPALP